MVSPCSHGENHQIRFVGTWEDPWWVGKDVCQALGIEKTDRAVWSLDSDEKDACTCEPPWRSAENDLYQLLWAIFSGVYFPEALRQALQEMADIPGHPSNLQDRQLLCTAKAPTSTIVVGPDGAVPETQDNSPRVLVPVPRTAPAADPWRSHFCLARPNARQS